MPTSQGRWDPVCLDQYFWEALERGLEDHLGRRHPPRLMHARDPGSPGCRPLAGHPTAARGPHGPPGGRALQPREADGSERLRQAPARPCPMRPGGPARLHRLHLEHLSGLGLQDWLTGLLRVQTRLTGGRAFPVAPQLIFLAKYRLRRWPQWLLPLV